MSSTLLSHITVANTSTSNIAEKSRTLDQVTYSIPNHNPQMFSPLIPNNEQRGICEECFRAITSVQKVGNCMHCLVTIREPTIRYACITCHRKMQQSIKTILHDSVDQENDISDESNSISAFDRLVLQYGDKLGEYLGNTFRQTHIIHYLAT
jgi:hypothetical protein